MVACCSDELPTLDSPLGLPQPRGLCTLVVSTVRASALPLADAAELTGVAGAVGASEVSSVLSSLLGVALVFLLVLPPTPAELSSRLPVRGADCPPRDTTLRPGLGLSTLVVPLAAGLVAELLGPGERVAPRPALPWNWEAGLGFGGHGILVLGFPGHTCGLGETSGLLQVRRDWRVKPLFACFAWSRVLIVDGQDVCRDMGGASAGTLWAGVVIRLAGWENGLANLRWSLGLARTDSWLPRLSLSFSARSKEDAGERRSS